MSKRERTDGYDPVVDDEVHVNTNESAVDGELTVDDAAVTSDGPVIDDELEAVEELLPRGVPVEGTAPLP